MPFQTEQMVPTAALKDSRVPRFHSFHTQPFDKKKYGTRLIFACLMGKSEDELRQLMLHQESRRSGTLSSNKWYKLYHHTLHIPDEKGKTIVHYA